jgi:hypothetical protein
MGDKVIEGWLVEGKLTSCVRSEALQLGIPAKDVSAREQHKNVYFILTFLAKLNYMSYR